MCLIVIDVDVNNRVICCSLLAHNLQEMVQKECDRWVKKGMTVHYISRDNRNGYKAGAMKEAMLIDYVGQCEYVTVFDADFQPASDFLIRTVPFLMHNPQLALVQTRWKFGEALNLLFHKNIN